jgi:50S ribosomal subunit-associated GTPase HflX
MLLFSTIVVLTLSCNSGSKETEKNKETQTETKVETEHHHDHEAIVLNNGEKWKVDDNMMTHIRNMEKDVIAIADNSDKNYKELTSKLKTNLDLLTSNCTMKGQAHNELHKWLVPYIELVDALEKDQSEAQFKAIQDSFQTFNQYFQ